MICALVARGKFKPELEFQAGTSPFFQAGTSSYHALYTYDNIGYVEVPEDHLYNTHNSMQSDEVSPYLMVKCFQVLVRKLLLMLLLLLLLLVVVVVVVVLLLLLSLFPSHYCVLGESINR